MNFAGDVAQAGGESRNNRILKPPRFLLEGSVSPKRRVHTDACSRGLASCRLSPELVAVAGEGLEVKTIDFNRPEAAIAGAVAQIGCVVGSADNDTLAGDFLRDPTIGGSAMIGCPRKKGLELLGWSLAQPGKLTSLDDPTA